MARELNERKARDEARHQADLRDLDRDGIPDTVDADVAALDGAWTVQRRRDDGLYGDVLATNSATEAYQRFRKGPEMRVLDNSLKDVAVDYTPIAGRPGNGELAEEEFNPRSSFEDALVLEKAERKAADMRQSPDPAMRDLQAKIDQENNAIREFRKRYSAELRASNGSSEASWSNEEAIAAALRHGRVAEAALQEDRYQSVSAALAEASAVAKHFDQADNYGPLKERFDAERPRNELDRLGEREHTGEAAERAATAVPNRRSPETLEEVLDRRAELSTAVFDRSEELTVAVDRVRDPTVDQAELARSYERAAREYALAKQDLSAFEAEPSKDKATVAKYRELQAVEADYRDFDNAAAMARQDGDQSSVEKEAAFREGAEQRREELLKKEGIDPAQHPIPEVERNTVERGLSREEIDKLVAAQRGSANAGKEAAEPVRKAQPAPSVGEAHNQLRDQSAFADAQARDKLVPEDVASTYQRKGQKYVDAEDPKKVAFVDKGNRLQTVRTFDDKAVESMVATADARGWTEIKVTGDEAFRRKAWIEATARGLEVKGYTPTEKDKQRAEDLGKATGHANALEKNETLEAYRAARDGDGKAKRDASREHPDLVKAFAFEAAARAFARQRLAKPADRDAFMDRVREGVERDLARGNEIPEVRMRQEQERRQDRGRER